MTLPKTLNVYCLCENRKGVILLVFMLSEPDKMLLFDHRLTPGWGSPDKIL
jgi:hypothetical protein